LRHSITTNFKPKLLDPEFSMEDVSYKQEGKIHLIRFIRNDRILHIFGEKFLVKPDCQYEYVKATIYVKEQCLRIFLFDEVIMRLFKNSNIIFQDNKNSVRCCATTFSLN